MHEFGPVSVQNDFLQVLEVSVVDEGPQVSTVGRGDCGGGLVVQRGVTAAWFRGKEREKRALCASRLEFYVTKNVEGTMPYEVVCSSI